MTEQTPHEPPVVVGVNGTQTALRAVLWAAHEARLRRAPLRIVHAAPYATEPTGPGRRRADAILARAYTLARRQGHALDVHTERSDHEPEQALLEAADRAQLLVLGMAGGQRLTDALIPSTALPVSSHAGCPVVVVRGRQVPMSPGRPVVVGVDDPTTDSAALRTAFDDARRHRTPLTMLHARHRAGPWRGHLHERDTQAEAFGHLTDALSPWRTRYPDVQAGLRLLLGNPVDLLLREAVHARLVVLGTHRRGTTARAVFGSTSREVLRACSCPVEVVHPSAWHTVSGTTPATAAPAPSAVTTPSTPAWTNHPHDRGELW
ncbi:universal stress protein [Pseudonocardia bannensis]|uniref:Universal stress protein n=1 Tax=Pseudonocardia bannensis TaxID=630973 RepID=A0A848DF40_9PSEU|nr:universal stress protein [Pseudonocardia bannensis]NMH91199.1 universal stress protein [Pseudonocardia bannensis]